MSNRLVLLLAVLGLVVQAAARGAVVVDADICVYGGTSGGVVAAVQGARMGKTVSLAVFNKHLGGLTTGGLGATDVGNVDSIQGVAREFYQRVGQRYGVKELFKFEPHVARQVYEAWLAEAGVAPHWDQRLASVTKSGQRITEIRMEDGTIYRAKMFIDATYEGDLIAMAGVSFTFGREGVNEYGESLNGIRANTPAHQFNVNVDPYVVPGNPSSGLLPFIQPGDGGTPGDGDKRIQAFNYRLCLTQNATNRLPSAVPANYDPAKYELLGRLLDARIAAGQTPVFKDFLNFGSMPNGKTDCNNNGPFSSDYIGMNWDYSTNNYAAREQEDKEHLEYVQGLIHYLATSPHSPLSLRTEVSSWGPCKDEWTEYGGYSPQIYVREARRMVSDYVMTQADCQSSRVANDSICLGSYNMDSHNCQRIVKNGFARNEGDVQVGVPRPYPISYRSIVPRAGECENVFVTFAISATHIAFGSTRMEPVFMMASQSAATAAAFAIDDGVPAQQVNYTKLALQLLADKQLLAWGAGSQSAAGTIVDDSDSSGVTLAGDWTGSSSISGYWGGDYLHDGNTGKGDKSVTFTPDLPKNDTYRVYLRWAASGNRASNAPVDVIHPGGTNTFTLDQTKNNGTWVLLMETNFNKGTSGALRIRNANTTGYVIADAARWESTTTAESVSTTVQLVATDPVTVEGGKAAKVTFVRPASQTTDVVTLNYICAGTASNGVDVLNLSGHVEMPAGIVATSVAVQAISDGAAEGDKELSISLMPGANYAVGNFSNAVVRVMDKPFDAWRFAHFSAAELQDANVSSQQADADHDGASNWQEFIAGTDPRDPGSVLRVKIDAGNRKVQIGFMAAADRGYRLQYSDSLAPASWMDLTNYPPSGTAMKMEFVDPLPTGTSNRFYRLGTP